MGEVFWVGLWFLSTSVEEVRLGFGISWLVNEVGVSWGVGNSSSIPSGTGPVVLVVSFLILAAISHKKCGY